MKCIQFHCNIAHETEGTEIKTEHFVTYISDIQWAHCECPGRHHIYI
jgi:hypothetical protein